MPAQPSIKIVFLIGSLEVGGAQRALLNIANDLLSSHCKIFIRLLDDVRLMRMPEHNARQAHLNVEVGVLGGHRRPEPIAGTLTKAVRMIRQSRELKRFVITNDIDVVISFMERANILNLLTRSPAHRIISIRKHLPSALAEKHWVKRALISTAYPFLLRRASAIVCNAYESSEAIGRQFPDMRSRLLTIPNYVDEGLARDQIIAECLPFFLRRRPLVAALGRLTSAKGFGPLLRAFRLVQEHCPDAGLVMVGDGPERQHLEKLAQELGIGSSVFFSGSRKSPHGLLLYASVFVLPSRSEGFPNALLEAMSLGIPVIAADCSSGPREILAPDTDPGAKTAKLDWATYGVLAPRVPDRDLPASKPLLPAERSLAEGIATLLKDPDLRASYSQASQSRAQDYARPVIVRQWRELALRVASAPLPKERSRH